MWFKKKLIKLIETLSGIEQAADKDHEEIADREKQLLVIKEEMKKAEDQSSRGLQNVADKSLSLRMRCIEMNKANISANIAKYEEYIKPLEHFFQSYDVELKLPKYLMKNNLAHF